jgi:ABC-type multidrug transport system fused ATPase/permease subunit
MSPKQTFQERQIQFKNLENQEQKKYNLWSWFRAGIFGFGALIFYIIYQSQYADYSILGFLLAFSLFLFSVNKHLKIKYLRNKFRILGNLNEEELSRLEGVFQRPETGLEFSENNHFYVSDLDLFGKHSLFKLINRTHTHEGAKLLANWMKNPVEKSVILIRQSAISELTKLIDFRQEFEVTSLLSDESGQPVEKLLQWIQRPDNEKIKSPLLQFARFLPFLTLGVFVGAMLGYWAMAWLLFMLSFHGYILRQIHDDVTLAVEETNRISGALKAYYELFQLIDNQNFTEQKNQSLKNKITGASEAVKALELIINRLSNRSNPIFALTGGLMMLWDLWYFKKLENWKQNYRDNLKNWLDVVSEFEALNSLAGLQFANPDFTIPKISEEAIFLKVKSLGHPMIRSQKRITNDISLEGIGKTIIITGSNMSGKSTFLRTVGVNLTLALMGGVVCAKDFECSVVQVFTSMRTQDSLEEDTSSFYAELKRLQQLISMTKTQSESTLPILYFLDEILKGTNSKDRQAGAKALMLQLHKVKASGFISTHDVELGDEFEGKDFIRNYSFSSEVIDNQLVFDYTLREGVCHSFNASDLMRQIGIEIL